MEREYDKTGTWRKKASGKLLSLLLVSITSMLGFAVAASYNLFFRIQVYRTGCSQFHLTGHW